jgi:hypothetical protein
MPEQEILLMHEVMMMIIIIMLLVSFFLANSLFVFLHTQVEDETDELNTEDQVGMPTGMKKYCYMCEVPLAQ